MVSPWSLRITLRLQAALYLERRVGVRILSVMKQARFNSLNRLVRASELTSHICSLWSTQSGFFLFMQQGSAGLLHSFMDLAYLYLTSPHQVGYERRGYNMLKFRTQACPYYHLPLDSVNREVILKQTLTGLDLLRTKEEGKSSDPLT